MSKWIKTDDIMPPENELVWVYDKKPSLEYGHDVHTAHWERDKLGIKWVAGMDSDTDPFDIEPTHWMPLPEPPKN